MKRGISAVVIIALLLTGFSVFKNDIAMVLFKRAITQQLSTDIVADYPDGYWQVKFARSQKSDDCDQATA